MLPFELASGDLRDELVAAVIAGHKTATSSLRVTYDVEGEALPVTGRYLLVDSDDQFVGVVEVLSVEIVPLGQVTDAVAIAEGEGFADATEWRRAHEAFWRASGEVAAAEKAVPGWALDDDTLVVVEVFRLVAEAGESVPV